LLNRWILNLNGVCMRRKIAFISEHASPLAVLGGIDAGGQNVYVAELTRYIAKKEYDIDVFTRWEDPALPQVTDLKNGVRVIHIKAGPIKYISKEELLPYMNEFRKNMMSFMEQEEILYDLVHANFFMSALVAMELKELLGIPYIVTYHALGKVRLLHQREQDRFPEERLEIEKRTGAKADRIIAECPQDKEDLCNLYGMSSENISIVPCGFCPSTFYPVNQSLARTVLGLNKEEKIILQLGRMVPRKGVDNVIRALSLLGTKNVRLLVVGGESEHPDPASCPELGRLQELAKEAGVLSSVTFTGSRKSKFLKYYYSAADLFITTPWYEPFGITPLESMACGTPVIGSDVGGIKYSVEDSKTGFLVPPRDPRALAEKIDQVLNDQDLIQKMQVNAIKRVHSLFTWARIAEMMIPVYEDVLDKVGTRLKSKDHSKTRVYFLEPSRKTLKKIR
jgi:D-inositol-3-phosphate glycosyltransferase